MSPSQKLRVTLACALCCSLFVTGLIGVTAEAGRAARNSLPPSSAPPVNAPAAQPVPRAGTVDEATRARVSEAYSKLPLSFEENRGQADPEVRYVSRGLGYTLFLTQTEAVLSLHRADAEGRQEKGGLRRLRREPRFTTRPPQSDVLRMKLKGANPAPAVTAENKLGAQVNYFKGKDPKKWQTNVARYERVRYAQVYPGVDLIYYGRQRQLEYDFEVAPGADPGPIALEFAGVSQMKVERATGELVLKTAAGEVRQRRPEAYQETGGERREVLSRYVMKGKREVGIEVGEYDRTKPLVIDPVLTYSTYLGSAAEDSASSIAVDSSGIAYVTGYTYWTGFPIKNQYQTHNFATDAFVTKLDTNASGPAALLYSTYLGGGSYDYGTSIAVDSAGNAYVSGTTFSADFPTLNQYQQHQGFQGNADAFVTKLDTNLSGPASLLYSTCLGGDNEEYSADIAVDSSGHAYVTGSTGSTNFPAVNAYQSQLKGAGDAYVAKLDPNASGTASLLYSTYLGGDSSDGGTGIAVDSSRNAYVVGATTSVDFPKVKAFQSRRSPIYIPDAFVTKLADSYRISGRVTSDGRVGISAVTMTLAGSKNSSVLTNGNGYYSFILVAGGDYTITPSKGDLIFIPARRGFVNLQENQTNVDFTTHRATVSGRVTVGTAAGKGLAGVTMTLTGGTGFATRTVITSPTGAYSFGNLPTPRSYKVTPSKAGYNFDPAQLALVNLTGNQSGADFIASPKTSTGP